jgi:hypothetical protein
MRSTREVKFGCASLRCSSSKSNIDGGDILDRRALQLGGNFQPRRQSDLAPQNAISRAEVEAFAALLRGEVTTPTGLHKKSRPDFSGRLLKWLRLFAADLRRNAGAT